MGGMSKCMGTLALIGIFALLMAAAAESGGARVHRQLPTGDDDDGNHPPKDVDAVDPARANQKGAEDADEDKPGKAKDQASPPEAPASDTGEISLNVWWDWDGEQWREQLCQSGETHVQLMSPIFQNELALTAGKWITLRVNWTKILTGQKLLYYEVLVKKMSNFFIGWMLHDYPLENTSPIYSNGSYALSSADGNLWKSQSELAGYGIPFKESDVIGSGIFMRNDKLLLFFTINGRLNGVPIVVENDKGLLYPTVAISELGIELMVNFGCGQKPFLFNINMHETMLFGD